MAIAASAFDMLNWVALVIWAGLALPIVATFVIAWRATR